MARIYCRWRRVLICVCIPCISLAVLLVYLTVALSIVMNTPTLPGNEITKVCKPGSLRIRSFIPFQTNFWMLHLNKNALWNNLQLIIDRHFNPILSPNNLSREFENSALHESIMNLSFSLADKIGVKNLNNMPKQMQQFVSHMHRRDYPIVIQPKGMCGSGAKNEKGRPLLLLAIKTTELNFKNRHAIRQTWGQVGWVAGQSGNSSDGEDGGGYVRRVFLLGRENPSKLGVDLSDLLRMESEHYGDMLQWDFHDTFFNLTLKDVLFWSWFSRSCSRINFVFKGDDDVFVNTPKMITYLQDQLKMPQAHKTLKDFMAGDVMGASLPIRDNKSKYFIPESFYTGLYPAYAGGGGVVYSGLLTKRLHKISKSVHLFPIDDAYVGLCMIRLHARPVHHPAFLTFDFPGKEEEKLCSYHTILLVHKRSPEQIVELWVHLKETMPQCHNVSLRAETEKDHQV